MRSRPDLGGLTRRQWLAGATGLGALAAWEQRGYAEVTSGRAAARGTARAVILVNLQGAPSHLDTFDAKDGPWNPAGINLTPGAGNLVLSRTLFPGLLKMSSDLLVLRSVQSWEAVLRRLALYQGRVLGGTTLYNLGWLKQQIYDRLGVLLTGDLVAESRGNVIVGPFNTDRDQSRRSIGRLAGTKWVIDAGTLAP